MPAAAIAGPARPTSGGSGVGAGRFSAGAIRTSTATAAKAAAAARAAFVQRIERRAGEPNRWVIDMLNPGPAPDAPRS